MFTLIIKMKAFRPSKFQPNKCQPSKYQKIASWKKTKFAIIVVTVLYADLIKQNFAIIVVNAWN